MSCGGPRRRNDTAHAPHARAHDRYFHRDQRLPDAGGDQAMSERQVLRAPARPSKLDQVLRQVLFGAYPCMALAWHMQLGYYHDTRSTTDRESIGMARTILS
jgi:hypothetical protein